MLYYSELFDYLVSGVGVLEGANFPDFSSDYFLPYLKKALGVYSEYRPVEKTLTFSISREETDLSYLTDGAPDVVVQLRIHQPVSFLFPVYSEVLSSTFWRYDKPVLKCSVFGTYKVKAWYSHLLKEDPVMGYYIETLSWEDNLFLELCQAYFDEFVARIRSSVSFKELPFRVETEHLFSSSEEKLRIVMEKLFENSYWFKTV